MASPSNHTDQMIHLMKIRFQDEVKENDVIENNRSDALDNVKYTTKIIKSVRMYVMLGGIGLKRGKRGWGRASEICGHIFETTQPKVKGHPEVDLL